MKRQGTQKLGIALSLALSLLSVGMGIAQAEVVRGLHTSPQLIINETSINDATDTTAGIGISDTVDLSGGDLNYCDFQLAITSGASASPTFDIAIQTSADGGTTWATAGNFTQVTSSLTATNVTKTGVVVAPGTKLRLATTLSSATTFYTVKVWAMPRSQ
jgi:hypothetical protein